MKTLVLTVDEKGPGGYRVRLFAYDGTQHSLDIGSELAVSDIRADLSLTDPPLNPDDAGTALLGLNLRELFIEQRGSSPLFRSIGEYLGRLLLAGDVGLEWERLRALYPKEQPPATEGRRTYLDIRPAALRVLPWELMSAPGGGGIPLALDLFNPILRGYPLPPATPSEFSWPLHAMIVVGTPDLKVNAEAEIEAVKKTLCRLDRPSEIEVLEWPSQKKLGDELQSFRPHVFHFIGHGREEPGTGTPALEFADGDGRPAWSWRAGDILIDLLAWQPRFACLNACRTAVGPNEQQKVWDVAEAFIQAGVRAVVGMQADVRSSAAALLPARLYDALLTGSPIDEALARARADILREEGHGLDRRDWALAALYVRGEPGHVLSEHPQGPTVSLLGSVSEFAQVKPFVDRKEPRRSLQQGGASRASGASPSLLVVEGEEDTGKTWLVYWCLKVWAWRGFNVKYVNLEQAQSARPGGTKSLLGVLRAVEGGSAHKYLQRALPARAFSEFNRVVAAVLAPARSRVAAGPAAPPDEDRLLSAVEDEDIWKICEAFRDALRQAAAGQPLIIVLDSLNVRPDHFSRYLLPGIIEHIALHKLHPVKMVLVVNRRQYTELDLASISHVSEHVEVPVLRDKKFDEFAEEFFRYHDFKPDTARALIAHMKEKSAKGKDYKPINFWQVLQGLEGIGWRGGGE